MTSAFSTPVPFGDLHAQYLSIKSEIDAAIAEVIRTSAFIRGPFVQRFEDEFAATMGASHCISCGNGTDSLHIAMHALGVLPGDEVIVPAHTWISTASMVKQAGGSVIFCDTDRDTYTMSPSALEALITPRSVGIIPVHLYGQPADMDAIMAIARKHKLWVLEDCAQAHLSRYKGKLVGTFGDAASFSFYPGKNLGAMGDAGALITSDAALARRMAVYARHGGLVKNMHEIEGLNSRLDGLQAAVLSVKLPHLAKWTKARQELAASYAERLKDVVGLDRPMVAEGREHVFHIYTVRHDHRDAMAGFLNERGIQTSINYPTALPFVPAYARLGHVPVDFPNAHRNQSRILALPIFPEMTLAQVDAVCDGIKDFVGA